ncbi:hypothetical protein NFI96_032015 [Prochilodus magdalenae]|nr:hypothetical protein NFI96_032015 [Prochilodus magdalenae]
MKKAAVNLNKLLLDFSLLEQLTSIFCVHKKITELKGENNILEIKLEETNRLLKFSENKETNLTEERDAMLETIKGLQNSLQQQCDLRVENEKLKSAVLDLKKQNEAQVHERKACIQRLETEMRALREQHQMEVDDYAKEIQRKYLFLLKVESKEVELKEALDRKESDLEEMRQKMKQQEKEKQSEIIKLQMEFSAKLARAQSVSVMTQQQPQASGLLPQSIFKRKLQFLQEKKDKEIEFLRQRVKELEQQNLLSPSEAHQRKRKI